MEIFIRKKNLILLIFTTAFVLLINPLFSFAQTTPLINSTLDGVVIDSVSKEPLQGAVVHIQGTTHAVNTDKNGRFNFVTGQKFPYTLIITYIGYQEKR